MDKDLALLHEKVDSMMAMMQEQQVKQQAMEEFKNDMLPIANHMIKLSIDELADIGQEFKGEDLLFMLKRVLRDLPLMLKALDQLESLMGLAEEGQLLGKQVFNTVVMQLDEMERKGYFAFASQGMRMLDQIMTEFDEEDAEALADNVVTIVKTMRNMTQPDIMALASSSVDALRDIPAPEEAPSTLKLIKELSNPQVRVGMARLLNLLKTLGNNDSEIKKPLN
ncbi:MAG: DUF1641 domain-containing protein [Chloroflexi bacterium]|jgi:uncharacterized protein YjgD (DUF1641 family)|nr:DUF1641 domain-containing protein [Chloroflexota bacterium]MBT4002917.1 DUF1641 domain-containing protein [Chloroflexota bacterium]MBT4306392.1 DUF1641 domain-containing protein [Chloroflexota bacterium]MBT4532727.1 DUF1641 domain-containing protein [Chloroflexota bacterium]MBT4682975.1 DUF1641 domain-containing protein [Chloroflexota bacterium]